MPATKRAFFTSIAAAIIFVVHTIIQMIYFAAHGSSRPQSSAFSGGEWEVQYLKAVWAWRKPVADMEIGMSFLAAVSLFLFLYTVQVLREVMATEKGNLRHIMANLFIIGGLLRFFEFLQMIGLEVGGRFVSSSNDLPDSGWVSLTITHNLLRALGALIFMGGLLAVVIGVGIISYVTLNGNSEEKFRLSRRHGILGIVVALFLFITFLIQLGTIMSYIVNKGDFIAMGIFGGISGLILWPAWLIWLGIQIRHLEIPADKSQTQSLLGNPQL